MKKILLYGKPGAGNFHTTQNFLKSIIRLNIVNYFTFSIEDAINFADRFGHK